MPQSEVSDNQKGPIGQITNDVLLSSAMQSMVAGESVMRRGDVSTQAHRVHPPLKETTTLHRANSAPSVAPAHDSNSRAASEMLAPGAGTPPPPPSPPQAVILGPFKTNNIAFPEGIPVGGSASLTLHSDGAYSFNGSFHDSGAPSYNVEFSWVIVGSEGTAYSFTASGHMAGTFESGSRDCIWTKSEQNSDIAGHWAELVNGYTWRWQASINWDVQAAVDSLVSALKTAGTIITTVIAVVAIAA